MLREGLFQDDGNRATLFDICEFASVSGEEKRDATTLGEYVTRMKPEQDVVYFLTGPTTEADLPREEYPP